MASKPTTITIAKVDRDLLTQQIGILADVQADAQAHGSVAWVDAIEGILNMLAMRREEEAYGGEIGASSAGPWTSRRMAGQGFEIVDAEGGYVLRMRGGTMPTVHDARLLTQAVALAAALRRLCERVEAIELADGSTPDTLEARSILARVDGEADRS